MDVIKLEVDTYHCWWCGWNGDSIQEQAVVVDGETRYLCYNCSMDVQPGPHAEGGHGIPGSLPDGDAGSQADER